MIDDHLSGSLFRQAEDPYEGKSFSEVLKAKREAIERSLASQQKKDLTQVSEPLDDTIETRKKRLQA